MFKAWNHTREIAKIKKLIVENRTFKIKNLLRHFKREELEELKSIAKAQLKAEKLFDKGFKMLLNEQDLRFTTPQLIADYRTSRLKKTLGRIRIVDLCSGIGSQTISFAKQLKRVLAVEIDPRKVEYSKKNIQHLNLRNTTVIKGDIFDEKIIEKIKEFRPEVIFCDPQRKTQGIRNEELDLIMKIIKTYSKITKNLVIEVPPFLDTRKLRQECNEKLKLDFESEYLSVESKLRRTTLYFSTLKESDYSVVELPSKRIIKVNTKEDDTVIEEVNEPLRFLIEPNPALTRASVIHKLLKNVFVLEKARNLILTSNYKIDDEQLKQFFEQYNILFKKKTKELMDEETLKKLQELKARYVVLKQSIKPEEYWKIRNYYEEKLEGTKHENKILYLFYLKNNLIIAELIPK